MFTAGDDSWNTYWVQWGFFVLNLKQLRHAVRVLGVKSVIVKQLGHAVIEERKPS